jgi:hypothetical protein
MIIRTLLAVAIVGILLYGVYELRFWGTPLGRSIVSRRQRGIRGLGLVLLLAGLGMWFHGTYIPVPQPKPGVHHSVALRRAALHYVQYWTLTFCVMLPLIPLAILDTRENLRKAIAEREKLREDRLNLASLTEPMDRGEE